MKVLAVVVLYQCRIDQSSTVVTLIRSWEQCAAGEPELKLIIYDNGPESQESSIELPVKYEYVHDPANGGLAAAYNYGLGSDQAQDHPWMLLLDQDSSLPDAFLSAMTRSLPTLGNENVDIVAVVPRVVQGGRPVSPALHLRGARIRPLTEPLSGIWGAPITAINSGTFVRRSFMDQIGGFNSKFKLDFLDHWLFSEIGRLGKKVLVAETSMEHDLSINSQTVTLGADRYRSLVQSENMFYSTCRPRGEYKYYLLHLLIRSIRQFLRGKNDLGRLTVKYLIDFTVSGTVL